MTVEIWLEDANGTRYGSGPIMTAQSVQQTDRLNEAGDFAFSVPTADPQALLIQTHRYARIWHFATLGGWQQVGYGRIERITNSIGADGSALLSVNGGNELALLGDRVCNNLNLRKEIHAHPSNVAFGVHILAGTNDYAVGDTTTTDTIHNFNNVMSIFATCTFHKISMVVTTPSTNRVATLSGSYYSATTADWKSLTVVDGTSIDWAPYAQSGDITFDPPADWSIEPGKATYELRIIHSGVVENTGVSDISIWYWTGTDTALAEVMAYAPEGWSLDTANGYSLINQRPFEANIIVNGDFATFTGTADDATTDTFGDWTNYGVNDGLGRSILAVTTGPNGPAVKLATDGGGNYVYLTQQVTVTPGVQHTLKFWCCGDGGVGQILTIITDPVSTQKLWYCDSQATSATWRESVYTFSVPPGVALLKIGFYVHYNTNDPAAAYVADVTLCPGGGSPVYLQLRDETVLQSLIRIAQATSENFILSPGGKQVLWLGRDVRDSGLRAVAVEQAGMVSAINQLVLLALSESEDASQLCSRVYPYGGGMGEERVTLNQVTQPVPPGYVLSKEYNYLERSAAITALGLIETVQSWSDITPIDKTETQAQYAANALLGQTWQYIETHSATDTDRRSGDVARFFSASIVKAERMILPGYTLRLQYDQWRADAHPIAIDRDVWITAVTRSIDSTGINVTGLELATVPRWVESDAQIIARNLIGLGKLSSHNTAEGY
jgi:hypothetical protein